MTVGTHCGACGGTQPDGLHGHGDTAELERFYGQLKSPLLNGSGDNGTPESENTGHNATVGETPAVIAVLEDQVAVLKSQLECERQEKLRLLEMLAMEQEKTKLLILPQAEAKPAKTKRSWLGYFRKPKR